MVDTRFCPSCGAELPAGGARFCPGCGAQTAAATSGVWPPRPGDTAAQPPAGSRRRSTGARAAIAAAILLLIVGATAAGSRALHSATRERTVTYEVFGSAKAADITFTNSNGQSSQQAGVEVPIRSKTTGSLGVVVQLRPGSSFYISAQNDGPSGVITCEVKVDGKVVTRNESTGGFTIATCSGLV